MWVKGVTEQNQVRFSVVYRSMIQNKLKKRYRESLAFFKHPISYKEIEKDIISLLDAYPDKKYVPTPLLFNKDGTILCNRSVEQILQSLSYALSHLTTEEDAYYKIRQPSVKQMDFVNQPMLIYLIRLVDIVLLCILCALLYSFEYLSFQNACILFISLGMAMYIVIWKL